MIESPISSASLYNQCSTLNYTQAAMMGLTGSSLQDSQHLGYSSHSNIPNIILTGTKSSQSISLTILSLFTFFIASLSVSYDLKKVHLCFFSGLNKNLTLAVELALHFQCGCCLICHKYSMKGLLKPSVT